MSSDQRSDDDGSAHACTFFMLDAAFVRQYPGKSLPFFQEIRDKYTTDEPLVEVSLDYADVVKGTHIETTLAVSHRWMQPDDQDPDGEQLKALKGFLNSPDGKKIERVWIDSACMPQDHPKGSRSAEDSAAFKRMLKEVNRRSSKMLALSSKNMLSSRYLLANVEEASQESLKDAPPGPGPLLKAHAAKHVSAP